MLCTVALSDEQFKNSKVFWDDIQYNIETFIGRVRFIRTQFEYVHLIIPVVEEKYHWTRSACSLKETYIVKIRVCFPVLGFLIHKKNMSAMSSTCAHRSKAIENGSSSRNL